MPLLLLRASETTTTPTTTDALMMGEPRAHLMLIKTDTSVAPTTPGFMNKWITYSAGRWCRFIMNHEGRIREQRIRGNVAQATLRNHRNIASSTGNNNSIYTDGDNKKCIKC